MSVCPEKKTVLLKIKEYASLKLTAEIVKKLRRKGTRGQAENVLWHSNKQGRVSASKVYEASKCKTDGVLVKSILGRYKVLVTKAIKRGKREES